MNTFKHLTPWGVKTLRLQKLQYAKGGTLAVAAEELTENGTWEPWAVLTVNVPAIAGEKGADDEHAFLDTNNGDGWWVRKFLEKYGLARGHSGRDPLPSVKTRGERGAPGQSTFEKP